MKKFFVLLLVVCSAIQALAINEAQVLADYDSVILPFFANGEASSFSAFDHRRINTYHFSHRTTVRKGVVVFSAGQSEPAKKYAELYYDLTGLGYDLYVIDVRGQGASERLIKDPAVGYVNKFDDYVSDLAQYINEKIPKSEGELLLLAHSMGAGIATYVLAKHPEVAARVKKAIFSSPMYKINTHPYTESEAEIIANTMDAVGKGADYAPGKQGCNLPTDFATNGVTSSLERFKGLQKLYSEEPEIFISGPSSHFVHEVVEATELTPQLLPQFKTPVLMFVAGKDQVVIPQTETDICAKLGIAICREVYVPTSQHEFFSEVDAVRSPAIQALDDFFSK